MKIIIVKNGHAQALSFQISGLSFVFLTLLLFVVIVGISGVYGWTRASHDNLLTQEGLRNWQKALGDQKLGLASMRQDTERDLDALTLRLAELQGRITRLDAIGERLAMRANLNDGEFDFSDAPALGGPSESQELALLYSKPALIETIDQFALQVANRERQLDLLDSLLTSRTIYSDSFVAGRPVEKGWLSSRYGSRVDPFNGKTAWHGGVDFAGKHGERILSMAAGVVTYTGSRGGYGLLVEVSHGNGYVTRYGHNSTIDVHVGDVVDRGQSLARMGSSGRSTGPHVHVEVLKNGRAEDPIKYINRESIASQEVFK
ncbi:MAG: M23 family metallopeptidase [Candidatus Endonucleobacter bathymodioli]|uniref:M23 family metallopeptidase n=1 Tax=Candidatus Endonucleibacter bathymodioli TaxID=539814 RepID=A0AA90NR83_9GAMM|nr:M23 family metallopeptidase [Candidatus Endonucleobacter bathymodioli]